MNNAELPEWAVEKLAKIAATIDIWTFEQESVVILAAEIRNYPELAKALPNDFCNKVQVQKPRELEPIERAAVILVAYDWKAVCDVWQGTDLAEKVAAQLGALAFALAQGAPEC
jgi:hypothetical protein